MDTYVTWPEFLQAIGLILETIGLFVLILQIKTK